MTTLEKLLYLKDRGVSMTAIAALAKCSKVTLSNWMTGKKEISQHLENSIEYAIRQFVESVEVVK